MSPGFVNERVKYICLYISLYIYIYKSINIFLYDICIQYISIEAQYTVYINLLYIYTYVVYIET